MTEQQALFSAISFINYEADVLDQEEFNHWLTLWKPEGLYVIPIDQKTEDFANTLNYAYDNQHMREKGLTGFTAGNRYPLRHAPEPFACWHVTACCMPARNG